MNIFDYIKWRGDLSFKQDPFNDIDNLILSYISYTNFDGILENKSITINEASEQFFKKTNEKEAKKSKSFVAQAPFVLKEAANSLRFKDCIIHDYVNEVNKEKIIQFSALEYDLPDKTTYIAFRGTDDSLVGWMEDLELAYEIVPAQTLALKYLSNNTKKPKKYRLGGHSKGGALALYAAYMANKKTQGKIIAIYNNDGPGINDVTFEQNKFDLIKDKYHTIFPDQSVFGQIFYQKSNTSVVKSSQTSLFQHDVTTWQIIGNKFVMTNQRYSSIYIKEELDNFFNSTTISQRKKLVSSLIKALKNTNISKLEFNEKSIPVIIKLIKNLAEEDEEVKKLEAMLISVISTSINKTISKATDNLKNEAKQAIRKIKVHK